MEEKLIQYPGPHDALSIRAKALVFHDPASLALQSRVEQVAPTDATVLIIGETGTGKELLAREIHARSQRSGPFVAVNCGAFSESLIDAELFGHEAGAYTGATGTRRGWFEVADGGTLFLDEIGDLALPLQVKLLRVLQERQVVKIGARRAVSIDVRLVAATNVDLQAAVQVGRFRSDLYFRLSVARLELPPLCARPADIMPLAEHFLRTYAVRLGRGLVQINEQARQVLMHYEWPGNIRELENVIHYALIVCQNDHIRPEDLNLLRSVRHAVEAEHWVADDEAASEPAGEPSPSAADELALQAMDDATPGLAQQETPDTQAKLSSALLDLFEQNLPDLYAHIEATIVKDAFVWCHHNQVQTARLLGISRNVLRTLLKRHGLLRDYVVSGAEDDQDAASPE